MAAAPELDERDILLAACERIAPQVASLVDEVLGDAELLAGTVVLVGDVARCVAFTSSGFALIELARTGERMIVVCPLFRVRRVAELVSENRVSVTVELDADRSTMRPEPDGSTSVTSGFYELSAPTAAGAELFRFASLARHILLAG